MVNGEEQKIDQKPGSFIAIEKEWQNGDKVEVNFPFTLRLEATPDDENRVAILYGPLVLAGDLGPVDDSKSSKPDYVPVLLTEDRVPDNWLMPVENEANTFKVSAKVASPRTFILKPFFAFYEHRYSVYWDMFNNERWEQHQLEYQAELKRKKELEQKTLDFFQPGEMQQERDHSFKGEKTRVFDFRHQKARIADRGGWFSFKMDVKPENELALVINYWGGFTGSKTFDIFIDEKRIVTENISGKKDGHFIDIQYDIDPKIISGKKKITVKFEPHEGNRGGPIFGARIIKR